MRTNVTEAAVELAQRGRWAEAANLNRWIVEQAPDDVRARNRLARALEALGRTAEAREAYSAALAVDARDAIAAHGLVRLSGRTASAPPPRAPAPRTIAYTRLEPRVEEPSELQDAYLEPYEEYETQEPERSFTVRARRTAELLEEKRLEELEGASDPDLFEEEAQQRERDRALAAEEESDRR